ELPRYKTALVTDALCRMVGRARKPQEVFDAIQNAQVTIPSGMGEVFKQAARVHRALDQIRPDVFDNLGQVREEPGAGVAKTLREQILEALRADEHVTGLSGVAGRWFEDSMKLLMEMRRQETPPPVQPIEPVLPPPVSPPLPNMKVTEGRRKIVGKSA